MGINEQLEREGGGQARRYACTASCPTPCRIDLDRRARAATFDRKWSGAMACVSGHLSRHPPADRPDYDWDVGLRGGLELNMYANRLGLNHWDMLVGMIPWLRACNQRGLAARASTATPLT